MKIIKDISGLVINALEYQDNDLIVTLLTPSHGFMKVYVKGAVKQTSKAFYIMHPLNLIKFDLNKLNNEGLSTYKSGQIIKPFDFTSLNYDESAVYMVLIELLTKISDIQDINYLKFYNFIVSSLDIIKKNNPFYILNVILLNILEINGIKLSLQSCVSCEAETNIVGFDIKNYGFVCSNCINEKEIIKDKEVLTTLYLMNQNRLNFEGKIRQSTNKEIFKLLNYYLSSFLGIRLYASEYIY